MIRHIRDYKEIIKLSETQWDRYMDDLNMIYKLVQLTYTVITVTFTFYHYAN